MYRGLTWEIPVEPGEKILYLTFDDGPHPIATPMVLDQLKRFNAKATFFCIGKNVADHREVYQRILDEGHSVGNHTYSHLNGWKAKDSDYIADVLRAAELIDSRLFRPPYGRITRFQSAVLRHQLAEADKTKPADPNEATDTPPAGSGPAEKQHFSIVMWSVLSADWDQQIDGNKCYENVVLNSKPGSIIVFHDSAKALPRLEQALPRVLEHFHQQGYRFEAITRGMVD